MIQLEIFSAKKGPFDCILMLDVLEHLIDPWGTLAYTKSLLTESGAVVISLPNVANLKAIAPLILRDEFTYSKCGILDKTHLRFFTKKSAKQLVESAGLKTTLICTTGLTHISQIKSRIVLVLYVLNHVTHKVFERFIVHQYIISAGK